MKKSKKDAKVKFAGRKNKQPLHRIAVHEAGHATACLTQGIPINSVTIVREGKVGGQTEAYTPVEIDGNAPCDQIEFIGPTIMAYCSGAAAEELIYGDCDYDCCTDDFINAQKYMSYLFICSKMDMNEENISKVIAHYKSAAAIIVKKYKSLLISISKRLLRKKTMKMSELTQMKLKIVDGQIVPIRLIDAMDDFMKKASKSIYDVKREINDGI